jgi:hypothetical protein
MKGLKNDGAPARPFPGGHSPLASKPPGEKINLHLRYYPKTGEFDVQVYEGGNLAPVAYEGLKSGDAARPIGGSREDLLRISEKILEAVLYGIRNDPQLHKAGIIAPPPGIMESLSRLKKKN